MAKQGNPTLNGETVILNTLSGAVADVERSRSLTASLRELAESNVLGYPLFSQAENYAAGDTVFHDRRLKTFKVSHTAGPWNAEEVEPANIKELIPALIQKALESGDITPALADNLANWDERTDLSIEDVFADRVRTAAGDQSINSEAGARIVRIRPNTDFSASAIVTTGFNLLRNATAVGSGWYIHVPALPFGQYGTAEKPNGLLFTDSQGNNLTPTVRIKPYSSGVPTSVSDGTACPYTDSHGLRFYTPEQEGYIIVSGINRAACCAHIGWSRRYNEYIAVDNVNDGGGSVSLTDIISAVHDFGLLLVASRYGESVCDSVEFSDDAATWYRRVGRVKPTWTTTENENENGTPTYTHTATIADMKAGGIAECGNIALDINTNIISYTDQYVAPTSEYVKYELATVATGSVSLDPRVAIEDWGLEMLTNTVGSANITMEYAQGYPDAVANLINGGYQRRTEELEAQIIALKKVVEGIGSEAEGYIRVAGSSDPALRYAHYSYGEPGGFVRDSAFTIFYPCLVGNNLSGNSEQIGKILYVLKKLGATTVNGTAKWEDLDGNLHAIDGSEGDVMVVNISPYYQIAGQYDVDGTKLDVFLRSLNPFTWNGIDAEKIEPFGESPDYTVAHSDNGTMVMHSVYNPSWAGSYSAPSGVAGRFVVTEVNGSLQENYDAEATLLGGAGGLHTTDIALNTGEQYAANMQGGAASIPYYNKTARGAELLWAGLAAEGGTFDSHKAALFGSGFCSNDVANEATYNLGADARNGMRIYDKNGTPRYYSLGNDVKFLDGRTEGSAKYAATCINAWRNPWHCMEAYRVVCHAIRNNIPELTWFAFEGCKYKWRSVDGYAGPSKGEATCVVFKMMSTKAGALAIDPTDLSTSIAGNRIDIVVSTALWHGITTQASPLWWTSGLIFTEDEDGTYEAYMQRDQQQLIRSENGEIAVSSDFNFELQYEHIMTLSYGSGYRKNYNNKALMLPDTNVNKSGASLHTYVGAYNYFSGTKAAAGKKASRGFLRGDFAGSSVVSPLFVYANNAPSFAASYDAFGTCCQIVSES